MIDRIKIFYNENKMWMHLGKYILISFLLAIGAILIDIEVIPLLGYIPNLFLTSVDLAKTILGTLSGSLLTITTFTFSTIMVVLTMYSSNFSPRVVENFLTEKSTMKVLGVFVGGFFYCILALFFMRKSLSGHLVISASIAVIYAALCIINFVVFVYKVSSSIQATNLITRLYDESRDIIDKTFKQRKKQISLEKYGVGPLEAELEIISDRNGYLVHIDFKEILHLLKDIKSEFVIKTEVGDFITKNQVIAILYYDQEIQVEDIMTKLQRPFSIEEERIAYNDYRFSIQKIVDIALRAISPGINDPNTAIHCINILGVILSDISHIKGKYILIKEDSSKSQIVYEDFDFSENLHFTFYQIAHYGREDISVLLAIFDALRAIARSASSEKAPILKDFGDYIYSNSRSNFTHSFDLGMLEKAKDSI